MFASRLHIWSNIWKKSSVSGHLMATKVKLKCWSNRLQNLRRNLRPSVKLREQQAPQAKRKMVHKGLRMKQMRMMKTIIATVSQFQWLTNIKAQEHQFQLKRLEFGIKRDLSNRKLSKRHQRLKLQLWKNWTWRLCSLLLMKRRKTL